MMANARNNLRSECVHDYFHRMYSFSSRRVLGIIIEFKGKMIRHTDVHLVVPETHKMPKVSFIHIHTHTYMKIYQISEILTFRKRRLRYFVASTSRENFM